MKMIKLCNRIIEYSFYSLFLLVPIVLSKDTSELFELNKMWLTWGITIIIATAWFAKMILQRRFFIQRTPLDIPIGLFLISQVISTIFSLDVHVSVWGYYSRFNGGLLSIISYVLLYYSFLSNFDPQKLTAITHKLLTISLISGLIVALWGLPSHFGYDPTCLLFRGTFDVSCWTADFMPKVRIFSTLGQPDWLAAYLAVLLPISIAMFIKNSQPQTTTQKHHVSSIMYYVSKKSFIHATCYILLATLFYVDILFTQARSGFLGIAFALIFFAGLYYWTTKPKISISWEKLKSPLGILFFGFLIITFVVGTPISQINKFTLQGIGNYFQQSQAPKTSQKIAKTATQTPNTNVAGGTESADIRLYVWTGAINAWKANPIFGTGVETFAFAYYRYKPVGQNLTSEWNFLYNKAHNEYLNYLATTGLFGLGTYLGIIIAFLVLCIKHYVSSIKKGIRDTYYILLNTALLASYISILVTNFFGFSVVIVNIYFFIIPAFVFVLNGMINYKKTEPKVPNYDISIWQWTPICFVSIIGIYMLVMLFRFWQADIAYALGYNLDRAGDYQQGYQNLHKAVGLRGDEPVFKDELSVNDAIIATALLTQKNQNNQQQTVSVASTLAQEAINTSNEIISQYTNNVVFWKTRVRLFYTLSQIDPRYLPRAMDSIQKASLIAPNDANILYNLGVLYGQNNNIEKGIPILEKTVNLKPDYRDAHYALGLFYHQLSLDEKGKVVVNGDLNNKGIAQMQYILDHIAPADSAAKDALANWLK